MTTRPSSPTIDGLAVATSQRLRPRLTLGVAHGSRHLARRAVRRPATRAVKTITADICVRRAPASPASSAALEAARLGRTVVIVDGAPALGGQAIGSIIGTIIGLYTHGPQPYQITHGIADDLIADLDAEGSIHRRVSMTGTITFHYDEVRLGRWIERKIDAAGIHVDRRRRADGRGVQRPARAARRARHAVRLGAASRRTGSWTRQATRRSATRPASRSASRTRRSTARSTSSSRATTPTPPKDMVIKDVHERLAQRGDAYGLVRHDGFLMHFPGKNFMLANVTHFETPLDPLQTGRMVVEGRDQADNVIRFLRAEFPEIFANAQIRTYGNPGIRQTRWIVGRRQLTLDDIRKGDRPADAAARCAWWVELHNAKDLVHWEKFDAGPRLLHPARLHDAQQAPTTSSPPGAAWTATSRRCRRSASWARASRWAPPPRTRSTSRLRPGHQIDLSSSSSGSRQPRPDSSSCTID